MLRLMLGYVSYSVSSSAISLAKKNVYKVTWGLPQSIYQGSILCQQFLDGKCPTENKFAILSPILTKMVFEVLQILIKSD